jgi:hypothetical protein
MCDHLIGHQVRVLINLLFFVGYDKNRRQMCFKQFENAAWMGHLTFSVGDYQILERVWQNI